MTLDIETALRETLHDRAQQFMPSGDPWPRFVKDDRHHRRGRRMRNAAALVAGAAALGLLGSGVVPLPSWVPALTIDNASSPLLDGPTLGSLGRDEAWLTAFKARIPELVADTWEGDTDGHWKVDDVDGIRVIFAGDVYRRRLVAALVPVRTGFLRAEATVWFIGPVGADPTEMTQDANGEALSAPYVSRVDVDGGYADVLVLAQEGTQIEASGSPEFRSDGTVGRTWTTIPRADTGEYLARFPASGLEGVSLRVTPAGGTTTETAQPEFGTGSHGDLPERLSAIIDAATAELSDAHRELASTLTFSRLLNLGLDPGDLRVTVQWAGEVEAEAALLLAVQPTDGGVLLFASRGGPASDGAYHGEELVELLAPADGAYTRPYAWRMRDRGEGPSGQVFVVAPNGAESAELRLDDGTSITVELDDTGAGMAAANADRMSVVAFDATGEVIGETPIPPLQGDGNGVPGETRATSVVLNEE
jgi:hypothetical protein